MTCYDRAKDAQTGAFEETAVTGVVEAIVLAAGFGSRMKQTKPLVRVHGTPSLCIVLRTLSDAGIKRSIVVLGHAADEIRAAIDLSEAQILINDTPAQGMASSLALGLRAVSEHALGALVLHADMPFVTAKTVRSVVDAAQHGAPLAAPRYGGKRGFPVFLSRACFPEILPTLQGEMGGRAYIAAHESDLTIIDVDDEGAIRDIDRPDDLPNEAEVQNRKEIAHALHEGC